MEGGRGRGTFELVVEVCSHRLGRVRDGVVACHHVRREWLAQSQIVASGKQQGAYPWLRRVVLHAERLDAGFFPELALDRVLVRLAGLDEAGKRRVEVLGPVALVMSAAGRRHAEERPTLRPRRTLLLSGLMVRMMTTGSVRGCM